MASLDSDCSWGSSYYCQNGCQSGTCKTQTTCGVRIESFDYVQAINVNERATVTFSARNTASISTTITYELFVDLRLEETYSRTVASGSSYTKTFDYYPSAGLHDIKVKATASCSSYDTRVARISVGDGPTPGPFDPKTITALDVHPTQLDMNACEGKTIELIIDTPAESQAFSIEITGIRPDWISYPAIIEASRGRKHVYAYVNPQEEGTYNLQINVKALTEGKEFSRVVKVFVAPVGGESGDDSNVIIVRPGYNDNTQSAADSTRISGLVIAGDYPVFIALLIIIVVLLAVFTLRAGTRRHYHGPNQPEGFAARDELYR